MPLERATLRECTYKSGLNFKQKGMKNDSIFS